MPEKIGLTLLQTELTYQGHLSSPIFRLLAWDGALLDRLGTSLEKFGATTANLRIETGPTLADAAVACWLFGGGGVIRVRAERMEGTFVKVPKGVSVQEIVTLAFGAIQGCAPNIGLRSHTVAIFVHASLGGGILGDDFLKGYLNSPPEVLGPTISRQLVYGFPGENERVSSSVEMAPSVLHPGALFARLTVVLDPQRVSIENALSVAEAYARQVADGFGFDVKAETPNAS